MSSRKKTHSYRGPAALPRLPVGTLIPAEPGEGPAETSEGPESNVIAEAVVEAVPDAGSEQKLAYEPNSDRRAPMESRILAAMTTLGREVKASEVIRKAGLNFYLNSDSGKTSLKKAFENLCGTGQLVIGTRGGFRLGQNAPECRSTAPAIEVPKGPKSVVESKITAL